VTGLSRKENKVWIKTSKGQLISSDHIEYFLIRERKDQFSIVACTQEENFVISVHEADVEARDALEELWSKLNHDEFELLNRIANALEKIVSYTK
jgi:hypothetical protein